MAARPYWLAVVVGLLGIVWVYQAVKVPLFATYAELGPGFVPAAVGAGLVFLAILLGWQISRGIKFDPQEVEDIDPLAGPSYGPFFLVLAATAAPLLTIVRLGFPITAAITFVLTARAFGSRRYLLNVVLGLGLGAICWWGFTAMGSRIGTFLPVIGF